MDSAAEAIVTWAEKQSPPTDTPSYRRLTHDDHATIVALSDQGKSQLAIAQLLGFAQSTVCEVLKLYTKRTDLACRFLDAHALQLAEKIVKEGDTRDAVQVLKGRGVLSDDSGGKQGITIQIGGDGHDIKIGLLSPPSS